MWKLFKKSLMTPTATQRYPYLGPKGDGLRGKPVIDLTKCTGCGECTRSCPCGALELGTGSLELNLAACVFCGLCQEKCPQKAVVLTPDFELAVKDKGDLRETYCLENGLNSAGNLESLENQLKEKVNKLFGRSLHIRHVDSGSCNGCDWDMTSLLNPVHDVQRLGIDFVASPRHADLLMCTGPVTNNLQLALKRTYDAVAAPKLVVAVGACACSGGIYKDGYAVLGGIDQVLPVDVFIPGCPPRPQAMIYGLMLAVDRLEQKQYRKIYHK